MTCMTDVCNFWVFIDHHGIVLCETLCRGCYRCWDCGETFQGRCELASHLDTEGHRQQRALRKVDDIYREIDDRKREEESRHFEQMQNLDHMSEEIVLEATGAGGCTDTTSIESLLQD